MVSGGGSVGVGVHPSLVLVVHCTDLLAVFAPCGGCLSNLVSCLDSKVGCHGEKQGKTLYLVSKTQRRTKIVLIVCPKITPPDE